LDKGNYNDKKTLSYFLEQEKIAKKMIAEAKEFYNSFLSSKIVTLHTVLTKYPLTPIIRASYSSTTAQRERRNTSTGNP
jgi:hypothetical protein